MNEKELCRSILGFNEKKFKITITIIGIVFGILPLLFEIIVFWDSFFANLVALIQGSMVGVPISVVGVPIIIISQIIKVIVCKYYSKVELVVTDKRIYGCTSFGKQVDLPIDSVSAVALHRKRGISVSTASGRIIFGGIENRTELYQAISKLLVSRQEKGGQTVSQTIQTSDADELKKYKDLFDSGVITQEEFDAKKKQILGI